MIFFVSGCNNESSSSATTTTEEVTTTKELTTTIKNTTDTTTKDVEETTTIKEKESSDMTMSETIITTTKKIYTGSPIAVGIWHRPNAVNSENDLDGIKNTLDIFKRCGINIVYLETIYHGMAMYKSNFLPYYSGFSSNNYGEYKDYLTAFTNEADKRGIEVHAWVEDFYIGIEEGNLSSAHPDWLLLNDKQSIRQSEGNGYIFLDPANPEVTNFLLNVYYELLTKNPLIRGINLDYIRYPVSSKNDDTGFTEYAMREFLESVHHEVKEGSTLLDTFKKVISTNYTQWNMYRADKITNFVKSVKEMTVNSFDDINISTAIFPNMNEAYESKKQDFTLWMKNHYIDVVTPMAYYDNTSTLSYYLKAMVDTVPGVYCYTGVSCIYHDLSSNLVNEQIDECLKLSDGFVIFGSQKLLKNNTYISLLENRFKNLDYYLPHLG